METLFQKEQAVISFNSEKKIISLHFISNLDFSNYKSVMNILLAKIEEKKANKLLIDQRFADKISMEEKAWLVTQWFPILQKTVGNEFKIGIITATSLFAKLGNEYLANALKSKTPFDVKIFNTMTDSLLWMNE